MARPTTLLSAAAVSAQIAAADIAAPGIAIITVLTPGLGVTQELVFQITATPSSAPLIGSLSPFYAAPGSGQFALTVNGANFTGQSVVRWNGSNRTTTRLSDTKLKADITAADVATAGPALVRVVDPVRGSSNDWLFMVTSTPPTGGGSGSAPTISLNPAATQAGSPGFTLSVTGSNFTSQSVVRLNGQNRATTYGGPFLLQALVLQADISVAGNVQVTVHNPTSGASSSPATLLVAGAQGQLPDAPSSPSPSDAAVDVSLGPALSWTGSSAATSYDVYFGTSSVPPLVASVTGTSYSTPGLQKLTTYYWRVAARNPAGAVSSPTWRFTTINAITNSSGYRFVSLAPCRLVDTRSGQGTTGAFGPPALNSGAARDFPVPLGRCGVPTSARAYSLNVTVAPQEPLGFLSMWPTGLSQPTVSTLNSPHGGIVANAAIVPAGSNGSITVLATNRTDLIIDINGYFEAQGQHSFYTVTPCRLADTRAGSGFNGSFGPPTPVGNSSRDFPLLAGNCGLPTSGAYSLNVTVVPKTPLGYLTIWPSGGLRPLVSTLNAPDGSVVANAAIVSAGQNGSIQTYVTNYTDVILDVNGYFGPAGFPNELLFNPVTPCRAVDTRLTGSGAPILAASEKRDFTISGKCGVPTTAKAYSLNVTVAPAGSLSYLTIWPGGRAQPYVSTLNSYLGRIVANAALVPAGSTGAVSVFVTDQTHVILDVNGYFQ